MWGMHLNGCLKGILHMIVMRHKIKLSDLLLNIYICVCVYKSMYVHTYFSIYAKFSKYATKLHSSNGFLGFGDHKKLSVL